MAFAGTKTRGTACGCCDPCLIGSDTFDGGLGSWTVTGSASTSGGLLEMTAGDVVIFTPTPASENDGVRIETTAECDDAAGTVRLIAAWTDANNYLFGERAHTGSAGTIRIGQLFDGELFWLSDVVDLEDAGSELNDPFTFILCWQPGEEQTPENQLVTAAPTDATGTSWTDPLNILFLDGSYAQWGGVFGSGQSTNAIVARRLNIAIPPGATPTGFVVVVHHADLSTDSDYVVDAFAQLLDRNGGPVGDNKALEALIGGSAIQNRSYGGPTDDWNTGLTWRDVASDNFGFAIIYRNDGPDNQAGVIVDYITIEVYFTTADRAPGMLTVHYPNTAAPNTVQCIASALVADAYGQQTGIATPAGDWTFTHYTLEYLYHETLHPECDPCGCPEPGDGEPGPPCVECCAEGFAPLASYTLDFGAGGFTDAECGFCDEIAGEVTLDVIAGGVCTWWLSVQLDPSCNPVSFDCNTSNLIYQLRLISDGAGGCKWAAAVGAAVFQDPGTPCGTQGTLIAQYESASIASEEDCQTLPVTLNLVHEFTNLCAGNAPASITLDAP